MNDAYAIEQQVQIGATAADVWSVLVTPAAIQQWLGVKVISDWQVGSAIDFNFEYEGKTFNDKGKIKYLIISCSTVSQKHGGNAQAALVGVGLTK